LTFSQKKCFFGTYQNIHTNHGGFLNRKYQSKEFKISLDLLSKTSSSIKKRVFKKSVELLIEKTTKLIWSFPETSIKWGLSGFYTNCLKSANKCRKQIFLTFGILAWGGNYISRNVAYNWIRFWDSEISAHSASFLWVWQEIRNIELIFDSYYYFWPIVSENNTKINFDQNSIATMGRKYGFLTKKS
jgi:hypothetical protein